MKYALLRRNNNRTDRSQLSQPSDSAVVIPVANV